MLAWPGLFGPLIGAQLGARPGTNAMVRTTTAVTMIGGGVKANVLPREASARVNFRLLPGDESERGARARAQRRSTTRRSRSRSRRSNEASPVADAKSEAFALLAQVVHEVAPDAVVAPALVLGGTDTAHYVSKIADNGFRFLPCASTSATSSASTAATSASPSTTCALAADSLRAPAPPRRRPARATARQCQPRRAVGIGRRRRRRASRGQQSSAAADERLAGFGVAPGRVERARDLERVAAVAGAARAARAAPAERAPRRGLRRSFREADEARGP